MVIEKWTINITECDAEKKVLKFALNGSATGPDGGGDASKRFVSDSGRVVIEPGDWRIMWALQYSKKPIPEGYAITWETKPLFVDTYQAPATPDSSREYSTTLAQGLSNSPHTVEIIPAGDGLVPISSIRVYRPPLK